jgi:hypothetical protein
MTSPRGASRVLGKGLRSPRGEPPRMRPRRFVRLVCPLCGNHIDVAEGSRASCTNSDRHPREIMEAAK